MTARLRVLPLYHRRPGRGALDQGAVDHYLVIDQAADMTNSAGDPLGRDGLIDLGKMVAQHGVGAQLLIFPCEVEMPGVDEAPVEVAEIEPAAEPSTASLVINLNVDTRQSISGQIEAALKAYGRPVRSDVESQLGGAR